ncbi:alanine racemase [Patescibacteria group bacterium]|nr:alanine racemase [Patescibacteria group bacterium]
MEQLASKTWVEISRSAISGNIKAFRSHVGSGASLMAVVKSNAYGHGLVQVADVAQRAGASWLGVDSVDEGIMLRENGITKKILVLGYTLADRVADCVGHDLSFMVFSMETVRAIAALKLPRVGPHASRRRRAAHVHVKVDTGTTRQGVMGDDLLRLTRALKGTPGTLIEGVATHYANIEDTTDGSYAELQLKRFHDALASLRDDGIDPPIRHTACSAAAILYPDTHFNLVRLGVSMYGLWPSKETHAVATREGRLLDLRPVMTWKTVVAQIKHVKKGTPISYGLTERVSRASTLALIPVGYWDGYDRGLSSTGVVLIRGRRCKVMGRICMNMFVVDATDVPGIRVEDEVVLLGTQKRESITADDIASKISSINYEVVTRVNPLIPRVLVR